MRLYFFVGVIVCNYCDYCAFHLNDNGVDMEKQLRARDVKLVPIGNSQGVRIPKTLLQKYGFSDLLVLEETEQGILLRKKQEDKLSWEETFKAMAEEGEDWTDLDSTLLDGLEEQGVGA